MCKNRHSKVKLIELIFQLQIKIQINYLCNYSCLKQSRLKQLSGQLPTYPLPNPTLTLTFCQLTVVELGKG